MDHAAHVEAWRRDLADALAHERACECLAAAQRALCACPERYRAWLVNVLSVTLTNREAELEQYGWRFFPQIKEG